MNRPKHSPEVAGDALYSKRRRRIKHSNIAYGGKLELESVKKRISTGLRFVMSMRCEALHPGSPSSESALYPARGVENRGVGDDGIPVEPAARLDSLHGSRRSRTRIEARMKTALALGNLDYQVPQDARAG